MPYKMPSQLSEVDDATAQRLTNIAIRRRKAQALLRFGLFIAVVAISGIAVAASI